MGTFKEHTSCPSCNSSDARAIYEDGTSYCYACLTYFGNDQTPSTPSEEHVTTMAEIMKAGEAYDRGEIDDIPDRKITKDTAARYGVKVIKSGGIIVSHLYPYYADNTLVATKVRKIKTKEFPQFGDQKGADLFGQGLFPAGGDKYITVFEGELDAMAGFQMMGSKYAAVSTRNGTGSAMKDARAQYEYLDAFDHIRICFDADKQGRKAAEQVAGVFSPGKVSIVALSDSYDACDYLKAGKIEEFMKKWWQAESFTPAGIVAGIDLKMRLKERPRPECFPYPWKGLNKLTYGLRMGEMVTITAGSGLGKTSVIREIVHNIIQTTDHRVGCMFLEETIEDSGLGMMSLAANKRLELPDTEYTPVEFDEAFDQTLGTGRAFFYDHFGSTSIEDVLARARYFVKALGCRHLLLDHISILVSDQQHGDERKALDEIATKLKTFVLENGASLILVSHTKRVSGKAHEEGGQTSLSDLRGTAAIGQLSNIVIGLERNGQDPDPRARNTTTVRVLKNRFTGHTGPACKLMYDQDTGRLEELDDDLEQLDEVIKDSDFSELDEENV